MNLIEMFFSGKCCCSTTNAHTKRSDVILVHRKAEPERRLAGLAADERVEWTGCTRGETQRFLGVQLCAEVHYANGSSTPTAPDFPLTGPARFNVYLQKVPFTCGSHIFVFFDHG